MPVGTSFPQCSVPHTVLNDAVVAIGGACHAHGIIGYISVSFLVLKDHGSLEMWATDIFTGISPSAGSYKLFDFLAAGRFNNRSGVYLVHGEKEPQKPADLGLHSDQPGLGRTIEPHKTVDPSRYPAKLQSTGFQDRRRVACGKQRFYVSLHMLTHPLLQKLHYTPFFHSCRVHGMCFDAQVRSHCFVFVHLNCTEEHIHILPSCI